MERWRGRVALVTGASKGIGRETTRVLAGHGMKVAACARSLDKLQTLADELQAGPGEVFPVQCDLRSEDQILEMFSSIRQRWGGVDVCVNNAGLAFDASILEGSSDQWKNMIDVNVMALCYCTREAVRTMRDRGVDDGHIININGIFGHRFRDPHFYSATKSALVSLTEGTRRELRSINSHIRVTSISPGLVKTDLFETMWGEEAAAELYSTRQSLETADIARIIQNVLSSPPHVQIHEVMVRPTEQIH